MQDNNRNPHNPWHSQNHIPWSPTIHPRIINGPAHAITFMASLMSMADAATLQAANRLEEEDLYLAAANVECGTMYLHIAEPVILEYVQDPAGLAALEQSQQRLTILQNQIIQKAGQYPLYEEPISCLRAQAQATLVLPQLQVLRDVLASQGQTMSNWDDNYEEAHISTAQFLAYHSPFTDLEDLPDPRPDLTQEAEAARVKGKEIADRITDDYLADMPINLSPAATATPGLTIHHTTGPLSPAFPRFQIHFTENAPETPIPYITFLYRKSIYLKTINEPYPKEFPQSLAQRYAETAADTILTELDPESDEITPLHQSHMTTMVETMENAARLGMHTVTPEDLQGIIRRAKAANLPRGAQTTILKALTEYDEDLTDTVLQDPAGRWRKRVNKKQALKVLQAARQNGIDAHTLAELADVMGYNPKDLEIAVPALTRHQSDTIINAVKRAGLPKSAATRVIETLL